MPDNTTTFHGASTCGLPTPPAWIEDVETWVAGNWDWFDPSHAHRLFWPDRPYQSGMEILVAGCGASQAAVIAYNNPQARVTAIDIDEPALNHEVYLRHKHKLLNLDAYPLQPLQPVPIEGVATLNRTFDLIIASGVLDHVDLPVAALKSLAGVLRPDGVVALAVAARPGLDGATPFTTDDCLSVVDEAGLVFQDWYHKATVKHRLCGVDRYLFTASRPERRPETYRIDFSAPTAADYVPNGRHGVQLNGSQLDRHGSSLPLEPGQLAMTQEVDGVLSVHQIAERTNSDLQAAIDFFRQLWEMNLVVIAI